MVPRTPGPGGRGVVNPRWRRYGIRAGAGLTALVLLALVVLGAAVGYARYRFDQVPKVHLAHLRVQPAVTSTDYPQSENILIVGNNTRIGQSEGFFGTVQQDGGARSDVTMVLHLDPAKRTASLLSIPRDIYVPLPAGSMSGSDGKIDASLNNGPDNLVNAVSSELGIPIDHYVELDFDGFQNVINAIGGIQMYFPMPLKDAESGLDITQVGCQSLTGAQALAVVRARHLEYYANGTWNYDPLSDLSRIRRDQSFLRVLLDSISQKGFDNPIRAQSMLGSLAQDITIDSGFSESDMFNLGLRYRGITSAAIPSFTLPITVVNNYGAYGDVDFPAQPQDQQVIDGFLGTATPSVAAGESVEVQDISGVAGQAAKVAQGLSGLGFNVTTGSARTTVRALSESVVDYPPGELVPAQALLGVLGGAVVTYPDPSVPAGTLVLQAGSVLAVTGPPGPGSVPTVTPSALAPASPGAPSPASNPVPEATPSPRATGTVTPAPGPTPATVNVPTPSGEAITPSVFPPEPYDPTACPVNTASSAPSSASPTPSGG